MSLKTKLTAMGRSALPIITDMNNRNRAGEILTAQMSSTSLGAAGVLLAELVLPTTFDVYLTVTAYGSLATLLEIIESPTITDGTSAVVVRNRNRNAAKTSQIKLFSDPTAISAGTGLEYAPFTTGAIVTSEWVLKAGLKYLVRLTNNGAIAATASFRLDWHEEAV
jgi:hypothetical protein